MKSIRFTAHFGDLQKEVVISEVVGNADGGLHLLLDNFYLGLFVKRSGSWIWLPQSDKCWMTSTDVNILIDMIEGEVG